MKTSLFLSRKGIKGWENNLHHHRAQGWRTIDNRTDHSDPRGKPYALSYTPWPGPCTLRHQFTQHSHSDWQWLYCLIYRYVNKQQEILQRGSLKQSHPFSWLEMGSGMGGLLLTFSGAISWERTQLGHRGKGSVKTSLFILFFLELISKLKNCEPYLKEFQSPHWWEEIIVLSASPQKQKEHTPVLEGKVSAAAAVQCDSVYACVEGRELERDEIG